MAVKVKLNLIDGATMTDGPRGLTATAVAMVSGLTEASTAPRGQLAEALKQPGVPRRFDAWPGFSGKVDKNVGLVVATRTAEAAGPSFPNTVRILIDYAPPGVVEETAGFSTELEVGTSLTEVTTAFELNPNNQGKIVHNQIVLAHPFIWAPKTQGERQPIVGEAYRGGQVVRVTTDPDTSETTVMVHQTGQVKVRIPTTTLTLIREQEESPWLLSRRFVGKTNRTRIFDDEPGFWLIAAITGNSNNGGKTFLTRYDFIYNPERWFANVIFQDGETRQPVLNFALEDEQNQDPDGKNLSGRRFGMMVMEQVEFRNLDIIT